MPSVFGKTDDYDDEPAASVSHRLRNPTNNSASGRLSYTGSARRSTR